MLPICFFRVSGSSMLPTFRHGDTLIGWRWSRPQAGQVVVALRDRLLVKRVIRVDPDGVWLEGDNPAASTDSRHFGALPLSRVKAVIVARVA